MKYFCRDAKLFPKTSGFGVSIPATLVSPEKNDVNFLKVRFGQAGLHIKNGNGD